MHLTRLFISIYSSMHCVTTDHGHIDDRGIRAVDKGIKVSVCIVFTMLNDTGVRTQTVYFWSTTSAVLRCKISARTLWRHNYYITFRFIWIRTIGIRWSNRSYRYICMYRYADRTLSITILPWVLFHAKSIRLVTDECVSNTFEIMKTSVMRGTVVTIDLIF